MMLEIQTAVNWITSNGIEALRHYLESIGIRLLNGLPVEQFQEDLCLALAIRYIRGEWNEREPGQHSRQRRIILGLLGNGLQVDRSIAFALARCGLPYTALGLDLLPATIWVDPFCVRVTWYSDNTEQVIQRWSLVGEHIISEPIVLDEFIDNLMDADRRLFRQLIGSPSDPFVPENINDRPVEWEDVEE